MKKRAFNNHCFNPDELKMELDKAGKVALKGIYFDTAKATLKPQSQPALNAVVSLMKQYPDLMLEVQGHTDSVGDDQANQTLSENRAAAVKTALATKDIPGSRLQTKGYGESCPVATNDTAAGRADNRRVELRKISGGARRAVITIDFLKPMPRALLKAKRS